VLENTQTNFGFLRFLFSTKEPVRYAHTYGPTDGGKYRRTGKTSIFAYWDGRIIKRTINFRTFCSSFSWWMRLLFARSVYLQSTVAR